MENTAINTKVNTKDNTNHNFTEKRIMYLDNLKLFLTILVIAHHTCQAYTLGGAWIVKDVDVAKELSPFLTVNMTFFMGAFFFISGYFIPGSRKNRTTKSYIEHKANRLLLPIIGLLTMIVHIYFYLAYFQATNNPKNFFTYYFSEYWAKGYFSYEHGWFLVSLFVYSLIYLLFEKVCDKIKGELSASKVILFTLVMAICTALIRIVYPIDEWVDVLFVIGIEPAHLPQYFLWFLAGTITYKNGWLNQISVKLGRVAIAVALITSLPIYLRSFIPESIINGGYLIFPFYESVMSVTIIIALVYLFQRHLNHQNSLTALLTKCAFGAYIIHNLFVITSQVVLCQVRFSGYTKFPLATGLATIFSFGSVALAQIKRKHDAQTIYILK